MDVEKSVLTGEVRDAEVESGIVDVDNGIGLELKYVVFAELQIGVDGAEIPYHFDETHDGEVAYMFNWLATDLSHGIASPETDLGLRVLFKEGSHEVGTVEVAGGFACYDVIFHGLRWLDVCI